MQAGLVGFLTGDGTVQMEVRDLAALVALAARSTDDGSTLIVTLPVAEAVLLAESASMGCERCTVLFGVMSE